MVNSAWYCAMLEELKPTIQSKCSGMLTNGAVLQHVNAQSHMAEVTVKII
jgi:hypothetical protein